MSNSISLTEQAEAVELAAMAAADALERLYTKVKAGKHPLDDYQRRRSRMPALVAAVNTMKRIAAGERV